MLRLLRQIPTPVYATPSVLGVDDFALRKGATYSTILADLERHRPVEMLPTRSVEALVDWLKANPGIEIITRDRPTEYTRGITKGASTAIQVADRFHLLCNLFDALKRVLDHNRVKLTGINLPFEPREPGPLGDQIHETVQMHQPALGSASELLVQQESHRRRQHIYNQVQKLYTEGVNFRLISKQLGISRMTVYRYLRLDVDPTQLQRKPMHISRN